MRSIPLLIVGVLVAAANLTTTSAARAEDEFDVSIASGTVMVKAKSGWHMNKDYPWKLTIGDKVLDKTKFTIEEASVKVAGAPKGHGKLRGAVCSGDSCKTFEKEIDVN
jgi:hypothetical protein